LDIRPPGAFCPEGQHANSMSSGANCNRPYGSRDAQSKSVFKRTRTELLC
jgi:hypothetical protein